MKVYNHKDAFVHLKYIFTQQKPDNFLAVINETVVHYGEDGGFDWEAAQELNIPCYNLQKKGGAMVTMPGDVVYCFFSKEPNQSLNTKLRYFLAKKLNQLGLSTEIVDNDLLVNNQKCFGFMSQKIGAMHFTGGHISIDCNLELIQKICTKPMEKTPGGLGQYNITTDIVLQWIHEFWFYQT